MLKQYMLKEVGANSENGDQIIVEQIFEKLTPLQGVDEKLCCEPLLKIVITDKVINLNDDLSFIHPRTGRLFKLLS